MVLYTLVVFQPKPNIKAIRETVAESPRTSSRRRYQTLDILKSSLQPILTKDMRLQFYKVELTQALKASDHAKRKEFAEWIMEQQKMAADFSNKIIFNEEAYFYFDSHIWNSENPQLIAKKQMEA